MVGFAALRLVTRRVWQFDLDDGVKAAAMVGVLVLGWLVVIAGRRRRLPERSALVAGLAVADRRGVPGARLDRLAVSASASGRAGLGGGVPGVGAHPDARSTASS